MITTQHTAACAEVYFRGERVAQLGEVTVTVEPPLPLPPSAYAARLSLTAWPVHGNRAQRRAAARAARRPKGRRRR